MTLELQKLLKEIGTSDPGKELKKYLGEEIERMKGDIDNVEEWADVLARRKAKKLLKEVFYFLEPEESQPKERNQYT